MHCAARRVRDVLRLHSLRELPFGVYTGTDTFASKYAPRMLQEEPDALRTVVTKSEALAFRSHLARASEAERRRAAFVAHFQW